MGIQKHGQGQIIPESNPEITKQAGKEWTSEDEAELEQEDRSQP